MTPLAVTSGMIGLKWPSYLLPWDPYLIWLDITAQLPSLKQLLPDDADRDRKRIEFVSVIVEVDPAAVGAMDQLQAAYCTHPGWIELARTANRKLFLSLQVDYGAFGKLMTAVADPARHGLRRLEVCKPRQFTGSATDQQPFESIKQQFRLIGLDFKNVKVLGLDALLEHLKEKSARAPASNRVTPRGVALCAIDDRCNFAALPRGAVRLLWDQSQTEVTTAETSRRSVVPAFPVPGRLGKGFVSRDRVEVSSSQARATTAPGPAAVVAGYGRERRFDTGRDDIEPDEALEHRLSRYFTPLTRWSHGSAIMSALTSPGPAPTGVHFVQLPGSTVLDTAGGSLASFALDGILDAVREARDQHDVVVNLSFGTHGGPHDGSSMFERALLQILDHFDGTNGWPRLHVVLPAGNSQRWRCHSSAGLNLDKQNHRMLWRVLPDNPDCAFLELWLSDPSNGLRVRVQPPHGEAIEVAPGSACQWQTTESDGFKHVHGAVIFGREVSQGTTGTMALVAVAPTQPQAYSAPERGARSQRNREEFGSDLGVAPHGVWTVDVSLAPGSPATRLDAWIQRGDAAPARSRDSHGFDGRQSYFLDTGEGDADPEVTLNGIACATHKQLWVVGAMRGSDGGVADYGGAGPVRPPGDRPEGPDIVEAVDASYALPGLLVRGARSGGRLRVGGTSIAAALFSRRLYHLLVRGGNPETLRHASRHRAPTQDPVLSPGAPAMADPVFRGEYRRSCPEPQGRLEADLRLARQLARD